MSWNEICVDISSKDKYPNPPNLAGYLGIQRLLIDQQACCSMLYELNSLITEQLQQILPEADRAAPTSMIPVDKQFELGVKILKRMTEMETNAVVSTLTDSGFDFRGNVDDSTNVVRMVYLSILDRIEQFNGFAGATIMGSLQQDGAFFEQIRSKALFIDKGAGNDHGLDAHRIQWFMITWKYHSDNRYFGGARPASLYQGLADQTRCLNAQDTKITGAAKYMWDDIVDCESAATGLNAKISPINFTAPEVLTNIITQPNVPWILLDKAYR